MARGNHISSLTYDSALAIRYLIVHHALFLSLCCQRFLVMEPYIRVVRVILPLG